MTLKKIRLTREDMSLSVFTAVGLSFILVWILFPHILKSGQVYKDLVVGALSWSDYDKDQEWKALNLFFACTVFFSVATGALFHSLRSQAFAGSWIDAMRELFWLAWIPAVYWLGTAFMRPDSVVFPLKLSGILILLLVALSWILVRRRQTTLSSGDVRDAGLSSILLLVLAAFSVLAMVVFASQFSTAFRASLNYKKVRLIVAGAMVLTSGFIVWNAAFAESFQAMKVRFHKALLLSQTALPLLLFSFVSQFYTYQNHIIRMHKSLPLVFVASILVLYSWFKLAQRYTRLVKAADDEKVSYREILSPASLFSIAVYIGLVFFSWTAYSFANDDFHIGEQLLPWQQIVNYQKLPYAEFVPIHGLMSLAYGGINALFYGSTVATFPQAMVLLKALFIVVSFWSIYRFAGPWPALLLTLFLGAVTDRVFFLIPVLLLYSEILSEKFKLNVSVFLWFLLSFVAVLYNVPVGAGLVLGSLPIVFFRVWAEHREYNQFLKAFFILTAVCATVIVLTLPLRAVASGFIHFVLDNAATNTIANGVGMLQYDMRPKDVGFAATVFQWVFLKMSWIVVAVLSALFFGWSLVARNERPARKFVLLAALIPVTFFMTGKWSFERVAAHGLHRDGMLSVLALTFFLPLLLVGFEGKASRSFRYLGSALIVGLIVGVLGLRFDYKELLVYASSSPVVDNQKTLVSGKDVDLPRIGNLFAEPGRIEELQSLRKTMSLYLKPGETFLDLTNRSALYYYLDLPVPVLYSADYVAANSKSLGRMLEQVRKNPPPLVLIAPRIPWDGGPASLRSYMLYKEVAASYMPKKTGDHIFLIRPDRLRPEDNISPETQMNILDSVFRVSDLQSIPSAWGRSWNVLKKRFDEVIALQPALHQNFSRSPADSLSGSRGSGKESPIVYEIGEQNISGKEADFILLDFSCTRKPSDQAPLLELRWSADGKPASEATTIRFSASGPRALVPLGSQPRWLLAGRVASLHVGLKEAKACSTFLVNNAVLLKQASL